MGTSEKGPRKIVNSSLFFPSPWLGFSPDDPDIETSLPRFLKLLNSLFVSTSP